MMRASLLLALCACDAHRGDAPSAVTIQIGDATLVAEVAADGRGRDRGLMFRRELPENAAMLFVFASDVRPSFWMKDTFIPLSLAFVDASQHVLEIQELEPFSLAGHSPATPVRYAIEANAGWFARHDVGVGDAAVFQLGELSVE